ncbi:non-specific lipid transfer protein GPI-anchored 25 [Mercurialis annua]|uniref:non-specific lipid transfer protein GPI-anchored 25 n=1 Tax=Mercurialis annua TaxID=3986 RepID=UPI00215E68E2|nr:non-specific lipid transfer protein GPI-anchored 25 [Mercurialis annua]
MSAISGISIITTAVTLLLLTAGASAQQPSSPSPSPPPLVGCTDELVAISPCLGYISTEPNNLTQTPNSQCCDALQKAFNSSAGNCFCYLQKKPLIFGFPLNQSRLVSLPSICLAAAATESKSDLDSICSESPALPPLNSITGPEVVQKPNPSGVDNVGSPTTSLPRGVADGSSSPVNSSEPEPVTGGNSSPIAEKGRPPPSLLPPKPTSKSSAGQGIGGISGSSRYCWFLLEALIKSAIVAVFTHM